MLKHVESLLPTRDMEDSKSDVAEYLHPCFRLGKLCFTEFTTNWTEPNQGTSENAFPVGALGCLEIVVKIITSIGNGKQFVELVKTITPDNDESAPLNDGQLIHSCLDTFQVSFELMLNSDLLVSAFATSGTWLQNFNRM